MKLHLIALAAASATATLLAAPTESPAIPQPPHNGTNGVECLDCHAPFGALNDPGTATGAAQLGSTANTLVDPARAWSADEWVGGVVTFTSGANDGQFRDIAGNDGTSLSWTRPLPAPLAVGDGYRIGLTTYADIETKCRSCHNPTGIASAKAEGGLHAAGAEIVGCGKCHEPHNVEPNSGAGAAIVRDTLRWRGGTDVTYPSGEANALVRVAPGAPRDGVCQTCHTQTAYFRADGSAPEDHFPADDCQSCHSHQDGFSALALDTLPDGLVGYVKDVAARPVAGATVYLVPAADVPTAPIDLSSIANARASTVDEPLEDPIALNGAAYLQAITGANGAYAIDNIPAGRYYVTVVPADARHLPGGSACRTSVQDTALKGQQLDVEVSSAPTAAATYVGASACLQCHAGTDHELQTLHANGIRVIDQAGALQSDARFPGWNDGLDTYFTEAGTTLYYFGYNNNAASPDWKVSVVDPGAGVTFKARLYRTVDAGGTRFFVDLANAAESQRVTYEVELSYGGGLYKQRYIAKIAGSRYVLPIQFNSDGVVEASTLLQGRWRFTQYNAQNWFVEATASLREPALGKSFDNNCAGCHFTGYRLTGDGAAGWRAHGVPDPQGEYDYDGDGVPEQMNLTCESCHGPGSEHVAAGGIGLEIVSPGLLTPEREITICAQCHTRALGIGGGVTEAPMNAAAQMPRPGIARREFLTNYVSKIDDGLWDAVKGDAKHSKKHHQQVSDFIKSGKYRNDNALLACSDCHDLHGSSGLRHQIQAHLDTALGGAGLCAGCHDADLPAGADMATRIQAHYAANGVADVPMGDIACIDCHMPKTAKSGSGGAGATIAGVTYWQNDISSHFFDVPRRGDIPTKAAEMMPIAYTNRCADGCHVAAP